MKTVKIKSRNIKREPWMTMGLLNSSKTKSKLHLKKLKKPTQTNILEYNNICESFQ